MLAARREHDGFLAAWTAAEIVRHIPLAGENLNPHAINPFRVRDPGVERELQRVKNFIARNALEVRAREAMEPTDANSERRG